MAAEPRSPAPQRSTTRPRRRWLRWGAEALLAAALFWAVTRYQERGTLEVDRPFPELSLRTAEGRAFDWSSLRGKRVLVHVWATWCGVCLSELGSLRALARELPPDMRLVTIVADGEDPERVRRFMAERHIDYPVLLGSDAVLEALQVKVFPTNYFVDATGTLRDKTTGLSHRFAYRARLGCIR